MKLAFNLSLFILTLCMWEGESYSLTNYQIRNICKKEIKKSNCIKDLQGKKSNLKKGVVIEIPVVPYKR